MVFKKGNQDWMNKRSCKGENNPFYGKKHSEESKKRMGAKKGSRPWNKDKRGIYSDETLLKMKKAKENYVPWNNNMHGEKYLEHYPKGKIWCDGLTKNTDNRIAKIATKLEGRIFTEEHRKKISESRWGENNPAWSGGNSFVPYSYKFNKKLKEQVAERDDYICQLCGNTNVIDANIHHWDYDKMQTNPFFMIFMCRGCNAKLNYNRDTWTKHFYKYQLKRGLSPDL